MLEHQQYQLEIKKFCTMDVSIIIVNYNTCNLTRNCLISVYEQTQGIDFEVIVSDNGSTDGSIEMIKREFPQVILIENNANLGFGKANNVGYNQSKGKYIFLLNSDTILLNNAVKIFVEEINKQNDKIGCIGCKLIGLDGNYTHSYGNYPTLWNELFRRPLLFISKLKLANEGFDSQPIIPIDNGCFIVEYVTGADLFIKRSVIERCGLFDEDFFMYYEETEMQYRYRKKGFYSCITPLPKIQHLVGGSSKKKRILGKDLNGLMLCYKKIYGQKSKNYFKKILFLVSLPIIIIDIRYSIKNRLKHYF